MDGRKRKIPNAKCRICGKEFYIKPYFLKHSWGKYCSRKCQNESQKTGEYVVCAYCGEKVYRTPVELNRESKTKTYFCNKSCQCAWKNKHRKRKRKPNLFKNLWRSWCSGSTTRCGRVSEDSNSSGLPFFFRRFKKKKINPLLLKRPSKKILYNLYWKENDWLFDNNIPHVREYLYPEGRYSCDFIVNDIFIEFFGLVNAPDVAPNYRKIMQKKREICRKYNIRLIELYENDLYSLDGTLGEKLNLKLN